MQGYHNGALMLPGPATRHGVEVADGSTCMDASGMTDGELGEGTKQELLSQRAN